MNFSSKNEQNIIDKLDRLIDTVDRQTVTIENQTSVIDKLRSELSEKIRSLRNLKSSAAGYTLSCNYCVSRKKS